MRDCFLKNCVVGIHIYAVQRNAIKSKAHSYYVTFFSERKKNMKDKELFATIMTYVTQPFTMKQSRCRYP